MPMIAEVLAAFAVWVLVGIAEMALSISRRANRAATKLLLWMERKDGDAD